MAVQQISAESAVAPNLVPMVDIMFLLLLFFMLGADMGQRELEDVSLPKAGAAVADDPARAGPARLAINVVHDASACADRAREGASCRERSHWAVTIRGQERGDDVALVATLREAAAAHRERTGGEASDLGVLIRADAGAPYAFVQRVMSACGLAGLRKIELAAAKTVEPE